VRKKEEEEEEEEQEEESFAAAAAAGVAVLYWLENEAQGSLEELLVFARLRRRVVVEVPEIEKLGLRRCAVLGFA